jgi:5,10-methylenetetrahydromethanopterin reductase
MRIGLYARECLSFGSVSAGPIDVAELRDEANFASETGFESYWLPQQIDVDAIMLAAWVAAAAPDLEIGVGVVPMQSRFPVHMAQAALTAHALAPGRFTLGLGVEHDWVVRHIWGLPFERPVAEMREYLRVVLDLIREGFSEHRGEFYRVSAFLARLPPAPDLPVLLGALGPRMLELAGSEADGTVTWLAGVETVRTHILPNLLAAADGGRRPTPRSVVMLPIAITAHPARVASEIDSAFELFTQQPSYQKVMARQQATLPSQVSIVGTTDFVADQLGRLVECGVTDLVVIPFGDSDERARTVEAVLGQ